MARSKPFISASIRAKFPFYVFWALLFLAIVLRWTVLANFCFRVADNDQYVLWDAAYDMQHGIFHEPCFYGQAYNPLVEPLFAQPLLYFGATMQVALPLVSGIFGFLPFVLLAWACFRKRQYITAAFAMAYLLWLPAGFQVITSIPRGYLPACAFASVGIYLALFTDGKRKIFWFFFLSLTGGVISQNCAFLIVPVAVYLFFNYFKLKKFYIQGLLGFLAALPLPLFIYWFYTSHPAYNMHGMELNFDLDSFQQTLQNTDTWFNYFTPFASYKFYTLIGFFGVFILGCLIKKRFRAVMSMLVCIGFFLFSLSFDKTWDGTDDMFFSSVRMFLGLPLAFIIFSYWAESGFKPSPVFTNIRLGILAVLLLVGIFCGFARIGYFNHAGDDYTRHQGIIVSDKVENTQKLCDRIANIAQISHCGLVILDSAKVDVDYMCSALDEPVRTIIPDYERRTWIMQDEAKTVRPNFIFVTEDTLKLVRRFKSDIHYKKLTANPSSYLVQTDGRKVFDILKEMKMDVRTF